MNCRNCHTLLSSECDFCNSCGAKVIRNRLTIGNLFQHFSEQFLNYDNRFFQTFIKLFKQPEDVIGSYINGTRKKYVNPVSYFAIAITLIGLQMFVMKKYFPEGIDVSSLTFQENVDETNTMMKNIMEYQSLLFMINIPIYSFISTIVFYTLRKYNYTEHLVVFLYTVSQTTFTLLIPQLILMALGKTIGDLSPIFVALQILYTGYCFKRIFDLSYKGIILRSLFFVVVFIIAFIIFIILFTLMSVLYYGGFEEFVKSQKVPSN